MYNGQIPPGRIDVKFVESLLEDALFIRGGEYMRAGPGKMYSEPVSRDTLLIPERMAYKFIFSLSGGVSEENVKFACSHAYKKICKKIDSYK